MTANIPATPEAIAEFALGTLSAKDLNSLTALILEAGYERRDEREGYCWCGCGNKTSIAANTNHKMGVIKGNPKRYLQGHQARLAAEDYLEEDRGYDTPCWIWQLHIMKGGYGRLSGRVNGKHTPVFAHRLYYERRFGPIQKGLQVHHLCRVRSCVNPDHLQAVTPTENQRLRPFTKLTKAKADDIRIIKRALGVSNSAIGRSFGVSRSAVQLIMAGKRWTSD